MASSRALGHTVGSGSNSAGSLAGRVLGLQGVSRLSSLGLVAKVSTMQACGDQGTDQSTSNEVTK